MDRPQHDWDAYRASTAESDAAWIRSLTLEERFSLYEGMFDLIWEARKGPGDWERLDQWSWEQKLALRNRMVEAFKELDKRNRLIAKDAD